MKLVVLGTLSDDIPYHAAIRKAANGSVVLPGAIYDQATVKALRFHARAYLHGHTVGGTNPSLVEALAAGNMVIAHDNPYNRWTAGAAAIYFTDKNSCAERMQQALDDDALVKACGVAARARAREAFRWDDVLLAYENEAYHLLGMTAAKTTAMDHASPGTV
ncbi:glycosyl transferase, partial [Mesorhizobium sp. M7A.F.Ca.US.006.04.2.1]